jgi:hypothetical protein
MPIQRLASGKVPSDFGACRLANRSPRLIRINAEPTLDFALFVLDVQVLDVQVLRIGAGFLLSLTAALRRPRLLRCAFRRLLPDVVVFHGSLPWMATWITRLEDCWFRSVCSINASQGTLAQSHQVQIVVKVASRNTGASIHV